MTGPSAVSPKVPANGRVTAIGLVLLVCLAALIGWSPRWLTWLQSAWFDAYQILKPRTIAIKGGTPTIEDQSVN